MPLKVLGAIRNEILIWKFKDNKQLTTELSIRRRLDKYLRRALILEERAGKQAKSDRDHGLLTRPPATRRRRPPNIGCGPTKNLEHSRAPCVSLPCARALEIILLFYLPFFVVECYVNMNVFVGNSYFLREFMETGIY